jgi:hypothetical protein
MKKEVKTIGKKKHYLLGIRDNQRYYLQEASWECGWYWGFGYVESYRGKGTSDRAWRSHNHFDTLFLKDRMYADGFRDFFFDYTPLSKEEIWKLLELMKSAYIAREYSDMLSRGGAHYTENPCKEIIKNDIEYNRINEVVIPSIMNKVYELLTPEK